MSELLFPQNEPERIVLPFDVDTDTCKIREYMKKCSVIFLACCRNVERYVPVMLSHIDKCGSKFESYILIVYENDSCDGTRQSLLDFHKENYIYLLEDGVTELIRTKRLERGRNLLLLKALELNIANDYQYFVVLDMDEVNSSGEFVDTIDTCFRYLDWDVLCANQHERYYDLWALRKRYDCETDIWYTGEGERDLVYADGELLEVDSAFGGIAIYRFSEVLYDCFYRGTREVGDQGLVTIEKCEHVDFHLAIKRKGGKIYINTSFFNF